MGSASEDWTRSRAARAGRSFSSIISRDGRIRRTENESGQRRGASFSESVSGRYIMICDECHTRYAIGGSGGIYLCPDCYRERFAREYDGDRDIMAGKPRDEQ